MFRFTIRDMLWLTVVVAMGVGWWTHYNRLTKPQPLYRDEEIEHLLHSPRFKFESSVDSYRLDVPIDGTSVPLSKVFKTLDIDPRRLTDFRHGGVNRVVWLTWRLSPKYDLNCATDYDGYGVLAFDDPNRKIWLVEIRDREERQVPPPALPPSDKKEEQGKAPVIGVDI